MPSSNICWGIELGAGAVKAVKLQRDGDELKVLEFAVIPHTKVLSTPELDQTEATRVAVGSLVSKFDLSGAAISIGVPGHSAFARFAKLPPVEPKKIPDIVKFEAVQQIPFNIDEVEWDYQTFTTQDSPDVEVGIFAITRDRIMERLALWNDVGVTPDFVTLGPIAVYNALAWDMQFDAKTPGTVILDVGTTSTDLIVCEPGRLWVRTFPIGGHQFTQALVDAFKLSYSKAEALKLQAEQSKHARHIFQAMRPIFGDLAQDVQRSIGYYQSSHKDANLTRLIGLGSTFNLPGLRKYLSQQLQMEVVRLEQFNRISIDGPLAGEFHAATPNLATAYGLALQGLGFDHGVMVNLMPVPVVREALWKRKTKWFAVAAGLSLAAGGLTFIRPITAQPAVNKPKPQDVTDVSSLINQLRGEWTRVSSEFKADFMAANSAELLKGRNVMPHIVDDLSLVLKSAADMAEGKPGLKLLDFTTAYVPAAAIDPNAAPPEASGPAALPVGTGRIHMEMELETTRDPQQAEEFFVRSVRTWFDAHANRPGIPYVFDPGSISYTKREIVADAAQNAAPAPSLPSSLPGAPPPRPGQRSGGARMPSDNRDDRLAGGGTPSPVPGQALPGASDVEKLAPIPRPPSEAAPGSKITRFKIKWDAVLRADSPAEAKS
ncbi:MAG: type IV pilus assembly protein PilM [Phycisphaerales bacterium]|nr:type IV pilus assembly protein PilM [Phycisphaerales bacterium]